MWVLTYRLKFLGKTEYAVYTFSSHSEAKAFHISSMKYLRNNYSNDYIIFEFYEYSPQCLFESLLLKKLKKIFGDKRAVLKCVL